MRAVLSRLLAVMLATAACGNAPDPPAPPPVATRSIATWHGRGDLLLDAGISQSGRFRVSWQTHNPDEPGGGRFRLIMRSAVSGRPLETLVDQRGAGRGTVNFADEPRGYDLEIVSEGLEWSVTLEEVVVRSAGLDG